jgi:sugar phosphate isomerase/epimerase
MAHIISARLGRWSLMHISIATANFYYLPFDQALAIIANAGFVHIELALYWERGSWAMAQHLRDVTAQQTVRAIERSGLRVSSIHDGGGVLHNPYSTEGFINPQLDAVLDELGYAPECIVFHTPHIEGAYDQAWWRSIAAPIAEAAVRYRSGKTVVTLENMPPFAGYTVPLGTPSDLLEYAARYDLGVTLDTTHYAQMGIDIVEAARTMGDRIRTIHLSDYLDGQTHLFPGEGALDFTVFFQVLALPTLRAITLESSVGFKGEDVRQLDRPTMISRLRLAGERLAGWLQAAQRAVATDNSLT